MENLWNTKWKKFNIEWNRRFLSMNGMKDFDRYNKNSLECYVTSTNHNCVYN